MAFVSAGDSGTRTSTAGMPTDSRLELSAHTHSALLKKSRWLYNNLGIIRRFVDNVSMYTVGQGISPIPMSGNDEADEMLDNYFCRWADSRTTCDIAGRINYWRMQKTACRLMLRDGDVFALKVSESGPADSGFFEMPIPRIQLVEAQGVGNLNYGFVDGRDEQGYRYGIKSDDYDAPVSYRFLSDTGNTPDLRKGRVVGADNVLHIYDPTRLRQARGLPIFSTGGNSAVDIMDLTALEKHAAKIHAALAAAISSKSPDTGMPGFTATVEKKKKKGTDGKTRVIGFENFIGGAGILKLSTDEKFELLTSNRDSLTFSGFIEYLIRDICAAGGFDSEFFWSTVGLGGPDARMVLENAAWIFQDLQDLLVMTFCDPIYKWVIARGIMRGELKLPAGCDPFSVAHQGPQKITVDQGKEGTLELERLRMGCATWEEYWAKRGKSGRKTVHRRIDELADAMDYAEKARGGKGVPFDYVIALNKGGDGGASDGEVAKTDGKPQPTKKK